MAQRLLFSAVYSPVPVHALASSKGARRPHGPRITAVTKPPGVPAVTPSPCLAPVLHPTSHHSPGDLLSTSAEKEAACIGVHVEVEAPVPCATYATSKAPGSKALDELQTRAHAGWLSPLSHKYKPGGRLPAPRRGHSCPQRSLLPSRSTRSLPPRAPEGCPFMLESQQQDTRPDPRATSAADAAPRSRTARLLAVRRLLDVAARFLRSLGH